MSTRKPDPQWISYYNGCGVNLDLSSPLSCYHPAGALCLCECHTRGGTTISPTTSPAGAGPIYHWRSGWGFRRMPDGTVEILKSDIDPANLDAVYTVMRVPANEWASIVAAVSKDGDNPSSYAAAMSLHTPS